MNCPKCGQPLNKDATICVYCGYSPDDVIDSPNPTPKKENIKRGDHMCPSCEHENKPDANFCVHCGAALTPDYSYQTPVSSIDPEIVDGKEARCPVCQSRQIQFTTKTVGESFNTPAACCGFVILGPLGLLCGLANNQKSVPVRKCIQCGHEF